MMRATLYHHFRSSSSWRVRWALAVKGFAVEAVELDLAAGAQHTPEHHARNPIDRVPSVRFDDGRILSESVAILEYLEDLVPSPALYPADPWRRARVRQLVEIVNSAVQPLQNIGVLRRLSSDAAAQREWAAHYNQQGLRAYEELLATIAAEGSGAGPFSVGEGLTAADVYLVPQVYSARRFKVDVSAFPRVLAAEAAALATAHGDAARPERQPGAPAQKA
jgi:maleylacetoacetate isomerase